MFVDCTALETVIIGEGIETIGYGAFSGCTALKDVILPSGVKTVSMSAFDKCSALTAIAFSDGLEITAGNAFGRCSSLKSLIVPNSLKAVVDYAFDGCDKLKYNRYKKPSMSALFADVDSSIAGALVAYDKKSDDYPRYRHNNLCNYAFADGHSAGLTAGEVPHPERGDSRAKAYQSIFWDPIDAVYLDWGSH